MPGDVRKGMPDPHVGKDVFKDRFLARFYDPAFDALRPELERAMEVAWQAYEDSRKAPRTRPAGPEFADPTYDMSAEWLAHVTRSSLRRRGTKTSRCRRVF